MNKIKKSGRVFINIFQLLLIAVGVILLSPAFTHVSAEAAAPTVITVKGLADNAVVNLPDINFTAVAEDGKEGNLPVTVTLNGSAVQNQQGNCELSLSKGENTIVVTAVNPEGNTAAKTYKVTYVSGDENSEPVKDKAPPVDAGGVTGLISAIPSLDNLTLNDKEQVQSARTAEIPVNRVAETVEVPSENVIVAINGLNDKFTESEQLTVPYNKFSELGLTVTNDDPGKITPLHVLAQYYLQKKGATTATLKNYIDVNADGIVNTIEDHNGIDKGNNENAKWVSSTGYSNAEADFTKSEVDDYGSVATVSFYGIDNSQAKFILNTSVLTTMGKGMSGTLHLSTTPYNGNEIPLYAADGSSVTVRRIEKDGTKTELTPENGNYIIGAVTGNELEYTFNEIGQYELCIQKIEEDKRVTNAVYPIINVKSVDEYGFEKDWETVNWGENNSVLSGIATGYITSGITVIGETGKTKIEWKSTDEAVVKIESDYDKNRLEYSTNNRTSKDIEVKITASAADPSGKVYTKTFILTVIGSGTTVLEDLTVEGIPGFKLEEGKSTYRFTLNKDITEIKVTAIPAATDYISYLKLKVDKTEYQFGEPITFKINPDKVLNSFNITVERYHPKMFGGGLVVSKSTYTIQFYKSATTLPVYDAFYGMARVDTANSSVVDALTPRSTDEIDTGETWEKVIRSNGGGMMDWGKWTYPIVVNGDIYIAVDKELRKYDMQGNLLVSEDIGSTVLGGGYTGWLAYGDGMIFVPIGSTVKAFNADDLSPLWLGSTGVSAPQSSSPIIYHNGYIYSGITTGGGNPPTGGFYCMDVTDEDPSIPTETKQAVWEINGPSFYWAGACIAKNYLIVPCDTGDVYSIDIAKSIKQKKAVIVDIVNMSENDNVGITDETERIQRSIIRSSILYDENRQTIYYPSYSGIFHAVKLNTDGTFDKGENNANVKNLDLGVYNNSAVTYNGRIYICGSEGLNVIDADTFEVIYTADFEAGESPKLGSLTLSKGYATVENGNQVYLYFNTNTRPNKIYVLADNENSTKGTIKKLYDGSKYEQFSTSNVVVADDGSLIVVNDYAAMFRVKGTANGEAKPIKITNLTEGAVYKLGEDARVSVKAENTSEEAKDASLIIALYDENNKLISYASGKQTVKAGDSSVLTGMLKLPEEGAYKLKAFVWDSLENMVALSDVIDVPIDN
ncbi:PQQ-binding-like beta-propeller repeat protein [Clostridium sp. JNZ X4-2]